MNQSQKALILKRNKRFFATIPLLTRDEVDECAETATVTEIELIALLNYMESEYRKSLDDFIGNYGNFSDGLNRIYNIADSAALGNVRSPFAEQFSEKQRGEWDKLLPVTLKRLKTYDYAGDLSFLWLFSAGRAERAARNNVNSLFGCRRFENIRRQGFGYKQWHTVMDGRERDTHAIANGQIVPIDAPFIVGGYKLMFPRDISYGAPPSEIINCRCSISGR